MTDVIAVNATPAAPVAAPVAPAVAPVAPVVPATPSAPADIGQARQGLRENLNVGPEPHHSHDQPRTPQGEFAGEPPVVAPVDPNAVPKEPGEAAPAAADAGVKEGEPVTKEASTGRTFETVVPPEWEMVDLPEGHPLRDRGITQWPVIPGFENETKNIISAPVRRKELEEAATREQSMEQRIAETQAEVEFWVEKTAFFLRNPEVAFKVQQIEEEHGADVAEAYMERVLREGLGEMDEKVAKARETFTEAQVQKEAGHFVSIATTALGARYADLGLSQADISHIIAGYGNLLASGQVTQPHADTLFQHADSVLRDHPKLAEKRDAEFQAQVKAAAAKLKAEEDEAARVRARQHPVGQFAPGTYGSSTSNAVPGTNTPAPSTPVPSIQDHRASLRNQPIIGS